MADDSAEGGSRRTLLPESLVADFEALGLGAYEARVLLTLLHVESATSADLARRSGVPRTSIYQVVDALTERGLALRVPAGGPARWCSPGRDEVLDRIYRVEEDRLRTQRARLGRIREVLSDAFPEATGTVLAYAHVVHGAAQLRALHDHLLETVTSELLVMQQAPSSSEEPANPLVLAALGRGVDHQILCQGDGWGLTAYLAAGARARLVPTLPMAMVVADRAAVLLSVDGAGQAATLFVEHPGFAAVQATGFERLWETARPP
ncbi:MAG TPA: helix-turn-helix domain-containing protein [Acidimicrobiales bacterium]|nr:helix-turn-helix domain-containing protein [Acidimicrobiales bacterium]